MGIDGSVFTWKIASNSSRVVYWAEFPSLQQTGLFSAPLAGGEVTKVSRDTVEGGRVLASFSISPDSQHIFYYADALVAGRYELFTTSLLGGESQRLNDDLVDGGDVGGLSVAPNSSYVVYRGDLEVDDQFELYVSQRQFSQYLPAVVQ